MRTNTPLSLPLLGLGTGMLASWRGGLSKKDAERLIFTGYEHGVNLIDTADCYASGECERLIGKLIQGRRDDFVIMTKAGYVCADLPGGLHFLNPLAKKFLHRLGPPQHFDLEYLKQAIHRSLKRLCTDRVDIFVLHDPPAKSLKDGSVFSLLESFKNDEFTRKIGISSGDHDVLTLALGWDGCDVIQTPLQSNGDISNALLRREREGLQIVLNHVSLGGRLPDGQENGKDGLSGLLTEIKAFATKNDVTPYAALLAIALRNTGADSVLTGTRSIAHLIENSRAVRCLASRSYTINNQ